MGAPGYTLRELREFTNERLDAEYESMIDQAGGGMSHAAGKLQAIEQELIDRAARRQLAATQELIEATQRLTKSSHTLERLTNRLIWLTVALIVAAILPAADILFRIAHTMAR